MAHWKRFGRLTRSIRSIKGRLRWIAGTVIVSLLGFGGFTVINVENVENISFGSRQPNAKPAPAAVARTENIYLRPLPVRPPAEDEGSRRSAGSMEPMPTSATEREQELQGTITRLEGELAAQRAHSGRREQELQGTITRLEGELAAQRAHSGRREQELQGTITRLRSGLDVAQQAGATAQREVASLKGLLRRGPCHHNTTFQPPRALTADERCTIEDNKMLPEVTYSDGSVVSRQLRFYGDDRSPVLADSTNILAVVPPFTQLFSYRWDLRGCQDGRHTGDLQQPVLEFIVSEAGTCIIRLATRGRNGGSTYSRQLTYTVEKAPRTNTRRPTTVGRSRRR